MIKSKKLKTLLLTLSMSMLIAIPAQAATYKVIPNDSLTKLSWLFGTSVTQLKQDNNLKSNTIYAGQALKVPTSYYTVKPGDSLSVIAKKHRISLYSLRRANHKWTSSIYPGQKLMVPGVKVTSVKASAAKSVIPYTSADLDLLARLIRAEAENQPYKAKVAVAAVVVNRVQSKEFPNSIKPVIYQRINGYYQFTPVKNGMINKAATAEDKKAALEALNGSDPSNGALFYFDDSATNKWLWSKPILARYDKMVFAQ
ncbi:LysM peptidoglycan-binding domain-containing protein [Clostridium bovifaecis]|uniref:LysM peptidoglycan-binding domain-containing protein n=1 Tax=Clostridium bovifaecis TaxID=2184719 RepID=A0A6I6EU90_9CLOT|nr:LysM peptidoglycan-binding domain-containing protein [Clostridium bovifaecis]